jgi:hypothetical protein
MSMHSPASIEDLLRISENGNKMKNRAHSSFKISDVNLLSMEDIYELNTKVTE